jgi:hypothetical protein
MPRHLGKISKSDFSLARALILSFDGILAKKLLLNKNNLF